MWDSEQMPSLVIPYSFDPHLGRPSEPPNGNCGIVGTRPKTFWRAVGGCFGHDLTPYLGTEPKLRYESSTAAENDHEASRSKNLLLRTGC
jgi:hypothetical protein